MNKRLIQNISKYLSCPEDYFYNNNVNIISATKNNKGITACKEKGLLVITTAGLILQADSVYYQELKNIYEDSNKIDFFEANNLSLLESLVREHNKMLVGPYLVLHSFQPSIEPKNLHDLRVELKTTNNNDLYQYEGFDNALSYEEHNKHEITIILWHNHQPVCIATATQFFNELYSIGINVLPKWRGKNVGLLALSKLTNEVIKQGKIPHYSVSVANTASVNLAIKAGYRVSYSTVYTV